MALKIHYKKKSQGVTWKSGHMYTFKYSPAEESFSPTYLHICSFSGYHQNTGHEWHFHQGINLEFLPRKARKRFVDDWRKEFGKGRNLKITWKSLTRKYPYLEEFTRRFLYKPNYYIRKPQEIPPEDWDKAIVKSMARDFSSTIKRKLASKLKSAFVGKRK